MHFATEKTVKNCASSLQPSDWLTSGSDEKDRHAFFILSLGFQSKRENDAVLRTTRIKKQWVRFSGFRVGPHLVPVPIPDGGGGVDDVVASSTWPKLGSRYADHDGCAAKE
jgi:hypothetical protein